jgi:hypothetical protein
MINDRELRNMTKYVRDALTPSTRSSVQLEYASRKIRQMAEEDKRLSAFHDIYWDSSNLSLWDFVYFVEEVLAPA